MSARVRFLNRLLGTDRAVVSEKAGTTTDAVAAEIALDLEGETERYLLLDTAGVSKGARRPRRAILLILANSEAIRRSDVSLLLVDATDSIVAGDLRIAREIEEAGSSCGVVVNKRDLTPTKAQGDRRPHLGPPSPTSSRPPSTSRRLAAQGWDGSCHWRLE